MIRELTVNEVEDVSGGNPLFVGAAIVGCASGAIGNYNNGAGGMAAGCILGAASGVATGMVGLTTGFTRMAWAVRAAGIGGAAGMGSA